jgi:shikimate kinase
MYADKIYLIGFMGSGKTTAGRKLASALGWRFIDMDRKVEEVAGKTIPEIFSANGEERFRELERSVLHDLEAEKRIVISTGGGAPCHDDNMSFMKKSGVTIYLKLTPLQLNSRLSDSKGERPLIKGLENENLLRYIENRLSEREQFYSQADIVTDGSEIDYQELVKAIREK